MGKPESIRKFDLLYLGSVVVGLIGIVVNWGQMNAAMDAEIAQAGATGSGLATGALIGGLVFGIGISLALWFLISVLRIELVKWVLIVLVVWNLLSLPLAIAATGASAITGVLGTILTIVAIWYLFKPDAKAWFAEKRGGGRS